MRGGVVGGGQPESSQALSPGTAEKIAQEAVRAAVSVIRRRLVECPEETPNA